MISSKNEEKIRKKRTYYICISSNSNRVSVLFPKNNWKNDDFIKNGDVSPNWCIIKRNKNIKKLADTIRR